MTLIAGLGNPGGRYAENRHNIGFMALDFLIKELGADLYDKSKFKGELYRKSDIFLLKPHTFMNLSGESVKAVLDYFKIENLIVIHDDIDLGFGALRIKKGGGHGGHNGLRSIDSHCGADYFRIRMGIGRPAHKNEVADYCLSDFSKLEKESLTENLQLAASAAKELCNSSLDSVNSKYSRGAKS